MTPQQIVDVLRNTTVEDLEESKKVLESLDNFFDGDFKSYITEEEINELEELWEGYSDQILIATIVRKLLKENV